jgi:DNA invertase Pin-like site-specific DNA recombinase
MITLIVLGAVAQFERNLLIERTQSGCSRHGRPARSLAGAPPSAGDQAPRRSQHWKPARPCRR